MSGNHISLLARSWYWWTFSSHRTYSNVKRLSTAKQMECLWYCWRIHLVMTVRDNSPPPIRRRTIRRHEQNSPPHGQNIFFALFFICCDNIFVNNVENWIFFRKFFLTDFDPLDWGKLSREYGFAEQNFFYSKISKKLSKIEKNSFSCNSMPWTSGKWTPRSVLLNKIYRKFKKPFFM